VLGAGTKANHLTYLGDCEIGPDTNVGAGTITCNYDGSTGKKSKTIIGARVQIGSDTQLVAPVTVHDDAYVGAGTTVTRDVPAGALVVTRAVPRVLEGWVARRRTLTKGEPRRVSAPTAKTPKARPVKRASGTKARKTSSRTRRRR